MRLLGCFLALLLAAAPCIAQLHTDRDAPGWVSFELGLSTGGPGFGAGLHVGDRRFVELSTHYGFFGRAAWRFDLLRMLALAPGLAWRRDDARLAVTVGPSLVAYGHLVHLVELEDEVVTAGLFARVRLTSFGHFPAGLAPRRGVGIEVFGNLNPERPFVGLGFVLTAGGP